jgi:hypothetical protein
MDSLLLQLCRDIALPEALTEAVSSISLELNNNLLTRLRGCLTNPADAELAYAELRSVLGDDPRGIKMLAAQLTAALDTRAEYAKRGIGDDLFVDTMKCFARFCSEYVVTFGEDGFDRGWWVYRHLGLRIFRLGVLEFEITGNKLSVHIPSDAVMDREALDASYARAGHFLTQFFPDFVCGEIYSNTWLLSPVLRKMLPRGSRILLFGEDYDIVSVKPEDNGAMRWIYKRDYPGYAALPEETTLQRAVKAHLLAGGKIGSAYGRYRKN